MNTQFFLTKHFWPKDFLDEFFVDKKWKKSVDFLLTGVRPTFLARISIEFTANRLIS